MRGAQLRHHAQQTARELALHTPVRPDVCNKCAEPRSTCAPAVCARPSRRPAPLAVHPSDSGRAREHYSERATDTCRSPALQAVPRPRLLRSVPWFPAYSCARGTQSPGVSSAHWHGRTPGSEYRPCTPVGRLPRTRRDRHPAARVSRQERRFTSHRTAHPGRLFCRETPALLLPTVRALVRMVSQSSAQYQNSLRRQVRGTATKSYFFLKKKVRWTARPRWRPTSKARPDLRNPD